MFPGGERSLLTTLTEYGTSRYDILSGHKMKHAVVLKKAIKYLRQFLIIKHLMSHDLPEYFKFQFSRITLTRAITEIDLNLVLLPSTGYLKQKSTLERFQNVPVCTKCLTRTTSDTKLFLVPLS